jgi:hypothetical protein
MLKTALATAALATALSLGATVEKAAAMPSATPTQLGLVTADIGLVQKTAVVCGHWGCRRVVRGARVWSRPHRYGFAGPRTPWGWSSPAWGWSSGPSWRWSTWGWGRPGWGW